MIARQPHITHITRIFINPAGKKTGELVLPIAPSQSRRRLDQRKWNRDEAIRRFSWYLAHADGTGTEAACDALGSRLITSSR
jgi:hypothetical protein